jgi:hypothetical protein
MDTGTPKGNAETLVSRPESDRVVTDSSDRTATGAPSWAEGAPAEPRYYAGELEQLIIWKINHIVETRCEQCTTELGELLRDWRSQSEPHSPSTAEY